RNLPLQSLLCDLRPVRVGRNVPASRRYPFARAPRGTAILACAAAPRCSGTHGGLPERSMGAVCKTVAKATEVRNLHPPHTGESASDLGKLGQRPILWYPAESSAVLQSAASCGQIVGGWITPLSCWHPVCDRPAHRGAGRAPGGRSARLARVGRGRGIPE